MLKKGGNSMQRIACAPTLILHNARVYTQDNALPWAQAGVLSSYYAAQTLIVVGMLRGGARRR